MEDIAEERAIIKLCGYVLCDKPLTKIVNQKYQISTLRNKVYDVEKVKNFCSYSCYTAAEYLMSQMLTSPLWLRSEEEIPEITIMSRPKARTKSPPGVEVNIVGIELPVDDDKVQKINKTDEQKNEESNSETINNSCDDDKELKNNLIDEIDLEIKNLTLDTGIHVTYFDQDPEEKINDPVAQVSVSFEKNCAVNTASKIELGHSSEINNTQCKRKEVPDDALITSQSTQKKQKCKTKPVIPLETLIMRVEKNFAEWITKETIGLLHGEELYKQQIMDKITHQEKYMTLCGKLNQLQLGLEKEQSIIPDDLKPTPNFSILQEESKNLEVKVHAFYNGKTDFGNSAQHLATNIDENKAETFVPLTGSNEPRALRRRIFLDKLNKVLPDLLRALAGPSCAHCIYTSERIARVKTLISTFTLSATNIIFKTAEWTLVALLIIKILGMIDPVIKSLLLTKQATIYMSMILMTYKIDSNYLDCLINNLTSPPINTQQLNYENFE